MNAPQPPVQRGDYVHVIAGRYTGIHGEAICLHRDAITIMAGDHRAYVIPASQVALLPQAGPQEASHADL